MPLVRQDPTPDVASFSTNESLRDGSRVEIHALRPTDGPALLEAVGRMSEGSLMRRFLGAKRHFSDKEIDYFVNVDFINHVALVCVADEGRGPIVAGGRYVVVGPGTAELAFVVVDDYQGRGICAALMPSAKRATRGRIHFLPWPPTTIGGRGRRRFPGA